MIHTPTLWLPGDPLDDRPRRDRRRLPRFREYGIGYPCCEECRQEPTTCNACTNPVPPTYTAAVAGVVNGADCTDCGDWNIQWTVNWVANCVWRSPGYHLFGPSGCPDTQGYAVVYWTFTAPNWYYLVAQLHEVHTTQESLYAQFYDVWEGEQVCQLTGPIELPYDNDYLIPSTHCDYSGATVTVELP